MKRGKEMKKNKKEKNLLYTRMLALGYDDVTDFARNSKVPLAFETCRRAIYENLQNIRHDFIVTLMQHLDFTVPEIKEELIRRGDKSLHKLISDSEKGVPLNDQETIIIKGLRERPEIVPAILTILGRDVKGKATKKG
jgi:hypothetical protein